MITPLIDLLGAALNTCLLQASHCTKHLSASNVATKLALVIVFASYMNGLQTNPEGFLAIARVLQERDLIEKVLGGHLNSAATLEANGRSVRHRVQR